MNTNTQIEKIDKVLSKISGKELKAFAHLYACLLQASQFNKELADRLVHVFLTLSCIKIKDS